MAKHSRGLIRGDLKMKILIIEDEKLLADSLRRLLTHKGFSVECVYDSEDGTAYAPDF